MWRGSGRKFVLPKQRQPNIIVFEIMEIMKACPFRPPRICRLSFCALLLSGQGLFGAELLFQRVPATANERAPLNLARYSSGAQIEVVPRRSAVTELQLSSKTTDTNTAEAALLCDDPTIGYALPSGTNTLLISFSKIENVDSVSFLNRNAKGNVTIASSSAKLPADSPQWHEVAQREIDGEVLNARVGPGEAKYIRLTFDLKEPGRISALEVLSTPGTSDLSGARPQSVTFQSENAVLIGHNLANLGGRARVLYVTSGDDLAQANKMIDNHPGTQFSFATNDGSPAVIVDLGKIASIRRISTLYAHSHGRMEFYVLPSLPGTEARQGLLLDGSALARLIPVASVESDDSGRAAADFSVTGGRYVMVKWTPTAQENPAFSIAEIAVFGGIQGSSLIAANVTTTRPSELSSDEKDGKDDYDSKDFSDDKDFKDAKEVPAEAPAEGPPLPLPPPPQFQFVPVVGPVSP
jgi:hypothetical protein